MVKLTGRKAAMALMGALVLGGMASQAQAWSHQGHILITRMAALRIINDPAAPEGLKEFLKANMKYDLEACHKLATQEKVGDDPKNYLVGLDGACTLPDRIQQMTEGKEILEPYGAPEQKMHFMDMEWLGKEPVYKADLSNRPKVEEVTHDVKDPRWKQAGYVPFRVEEEYGKLVKAFGSTEKVDEGEALKAAGYLCHYLEDCHQPHHATIDYKSFSYLAGKVKQVHEVKTTLSDGKVVVDYKADGRTINPHGDIEAQLFENAEEPRKGFREEFWKELNLRIEKKAKDREIIKHLPVRAGSFEHALTILSDSYEYLPAVGKAAQAAYASGKFDPAAFFTSKDTVHGEELDMVQLIAERKACAVLEVERTLRAAWEEAHKKPEAGSQK